MSINNVRESTPINARRSEIFQQEAGVFPHSKIDSYSANPCNHNHTFHFPTLWSLWQSSLKKKHKQTSKQKTQKETKKTNKPKVASNKINSTHILQLLSYTQLSLQKAALTQKGHPKSTGINSLKHCIFTGINSFKHGIFITQFSFMCHVPSK